jgi:hypothetical protein
VIDYWPTVFLAFKKLGALGIGQGRGRFRISRVESVRGCEVKEVYTDDTGTLAAGLLRCAPAMFFRNTEQSVSRLVLQLLTPTQLTHANRPVSAKADLAFHVFMRRLLGRLSDLSYHHGGERFGWNYQGIIQRAERVYMHETASAIAYRSIEVHSARQDPTSTREASYQLTGFVGTVVYEGEGLAAFLPYLRLGEYTHVGKKTVQGAGMYKLLEPASGSPFVGCSLERGGDQTLQARKLPWA